MLTPLVAPTPQTWLPVALGDFNAVLVDHAHCEKKAAAQAMSLVAQYCQHSFLIEPLVALAQEELRHFRQVYKLMRARSLALTSDKGDPYVKELLRLSRDGPTERLVDRLLLSALVEARSAERLELLGNGLGQGAEGEFYRRLARTEAGHFRLYVRLAKKVWPSAKEVDQRLIFLAERESQLMLAQPVCARIH